MAIKKAATKELANYDEELAALAASAAEKEANAGGGGNYLSFKGGSLTYKEAEVPDNTIDIVILHHVFENSFYEGRFNPNDPKSPECFAIGEDEKELAPHEDAEGAVSESCVGCPNNEWGSASEGRGKACKNVRRVAFILAEDLETGVEAAEPTFFRPPVTSVKVWANYIKKLAADKKAPLQVVTRLTVVPDDSQFHLTFERVADVNPAHYPELLAKRKSPEVMDTLLKPFAKNSERAPVAPKKGLKAPPKGVRGRG